MIPEKDEELNGSERNAEDENNQFASGSMEEAEIRDESDADDGVSDSSESVVQEEFPEAFDELSDDNLIADLEALADELQVSSETEQAAADEDFLPAEEEETVPEDFSPKEIAADGDFSSLEAEATAPEDFSTEEEATAPEDFLPEGEEPAPEDFSPEGEEPAPEDFSPEEEATAPEDFSPEGEEPAPEDFSTEEEATAPDDADLLTIEINDLVDELQEKNQEKLGDSRSEEETKMSSDELLQLAEELANEHTEPDDEGFAENMISENNDSDQAIAQDDATDRSEPDSGTSELDSLAMVMNAENGEADSFTCDEEEESERDDPVTEYVELDSLAKSINGEKEETVPFIDDDDDDVKVYVGKKESADSHTEDDGVPLPFADNAYDDAEQLEKTIVNIPLRETPAEVNITGEGDFGQTSVFDPVRPQPAYGEAGGRTHDDKKTKKNRHGLFRGLSLIAGLLIAVVFLSWLLSSVAFNVMGADDTASAEEYNYSTTSTIVKPFNDEQPEPVVVPAFTAEKLRSGDTGDMVDAVQRTLASLGYLSQENVSGVYDSATEKAVMQFQKANYLDPTGEVDSRTYELIFDANATVPTTRTTDLPTTTEAETTATSTVTQSTSASLESTTSSTTAQTAKTTTTASAVPTKSTESTEKTETEPTKPTTETPSSQEETTVPMTTGTTAVADDNNDDAVG